jgi:hypothetical protein
MPDEDLTNHVVYHTESFFKAVSDMVANIIGAILVLIPVIVLHFIRDPDMRLVVIVIFSLVFTACMVQFTDARRSEVFAATAAFVAVQVVYVGSTLNN